MLRVVKKHNKLSNRAEFIRQHKKGAGFTLIEMLLAVFIFSILVLMIAGIYLSFSKAQARAKASQELLNNSQYVFELMAREIRNNTIFDYNPAGSCVSLIGADYTDCIILVQEDGRLISFAGDAVNNRLLYVVPDNCYINNYSSCNWGISQPKTFTILLEPAFNNIKVNNLKFVINPSSDPYSDDAVENQQPLVTIQLQTEYTGSKDIEKVSYTLQTSVSSRIYKR